MINNSKEISRAHLLFRVFAGHTREAGIRETLKRAARKFIRSVSTMTAKEDAIHPFDRKYGTDTSGNVQPWALDIPGDMVFHAVKYGTAIVEVFTEILASLSINYREFTFIDLGSGKGRALLLASRLPFKEIIGIELSPKLHGTACRNISIYRDELQQCKTISSRCENAGDFQLPYEKAVFYLFNPFDEYVMGSVLANIERSINRGNREIYIAYLKPVHRNLFDRAAFLTIYKETERYVIYRTRAGFNAVSSSEIII